MKLTFL